MIAGIGGRLSRVTKALLPAFADGPVVTGPVVGGLVEASTSVQDVLAALRAAAAWPAAPRPVSSDDLLAERAIAGDSRAVRAPVSGVYRHLDGDPTLLATADGFIASGGAIEATARQLFVHANTVRYRLRRIAELCGHDLADPRDRYVVQVAIALGRLELDGTVSFLLVGSLQRRTAQRLCDLTLTDSRFTRGLGPCSPSSRPVKALRSKAFLRPG